MSNLRAGREFGFKGERKTVNGQQSTVNGTNRANQMAAIKELIGPNPLRHIILADAAPPSIAAFQRAAVSIRLNIAEGFALADFGRFGNHLAIAYGSAVEPEECLELMMEEGILPEESVRETIERCQRCERLLLGLLKKYRPLGGSR